MLTKEECLKALHNLSGVLVTREHDKKETVECINVLKTLIEEHFSSSASQVDSSLTRSNPPEFEMKHKAQESLDTIECKAFSDNEICEIRLMTGRCKDCKVKEDLKTIQDLFECQLNPEEIDTVITALADDKFIEHKKKIVIRDKLNKHYGMWEKE